MSDIAQAFLPKSASLDLRYGVVDAVGTGTVDVKIGGSDVVVEGLRHMDDYSPTVADTVALLVTGRDVLVLGKLA